MAKLGLGRTQRFYQNPVLRDAEWDRAKEAPWWLMVLTIAIVAVAFFFGVYASGPQSIAGWIVGIIMVAIYLILGWQRRRRARQRLRQLHGQPAS